LMNEIINLQVGQCLLFSPSSMVDVVDGTVGRLGQRFIKFKTRRRITDDGGRSVLSLANH
jgi:tRNA-dihydrouridine synthase